MNDPTDVLVLRDLWEVLQLFLVVVGFWLALPILAWIKGLFDD